MTIVNFWQCPKCKMISISEIKDASNEQIKFCSYCKVEKCKECGTEKLETRIQMKKVGHILVDTY